MTIAATDGERAGLVDPSVACRLTRRLISTPLHPWVKQLYIDMSLSHNGDLWIITGQSQIDEATPIPPTVTSVKLWADRYYKSGHARTEEDEIDVSSLSHLPSHVKKLTLDGVSVRGLITFAEGLEELLLIKVTTKVSFLQWVFPESLRHVVVETEEFSDLRSVTAPAITIWQANDGTDTNRQFLLPESLVELTIDNGGGSRALRMTYPELIDGLIMPDDYRTEDMMPSTDIVLLPPHLEHLTLIHPDEILECGPSQLSKVKSLTVEDANDPFDFGGLFSELEHLKLGRITLSFNDSIELSKLKSFKIDYSGSIPSHRLAVSFPSLESLSISHCANHQIPAVYDKLGASLVTLVLDNVNNFPEGEDWPRLESVTITKSVIDLPLMPRLQELEIDGPQMANGYEIQDFIEYRQAWGLATRKKGANMARP